MELSHHDTQIGPRILSGPVAGGVICTEAFGVRDESSDRRCKMALGNSAIFTAEGKYRSSMTYVRSALSRAIILCPTVDARNPM